MLFQGITTYHNLDNSNFFTEDGYLMTGDVGTMLTNTGFTSDFRMYADVLRSKLSLQDTKYDRIS